MPLIRRIPKRGFTNVFRRPYEVVHLKDLAGFGKGETVTPERLREKGLIHGDRVKVLSDGALTHSLTVHAHAFSQKAKGLIEKAGGKAEVIASHV
jgi:large subunit ribosomal protein L15